MTRTIRIDDDVYEGLKKLVTDPFEETPNTVIRKLLNERIGLLPATPKPKKNISKRTKMGKLTQQSVYENWLLYSLWKYFDGSGQKHEVTKKTIELMKNQNILNAPDYERVSTGESKAENTIAWGRNKLKEENKISGDSLRGVWELTDHGIEMAKKLEETLFG